MSLVIIIVIVIILIIIIIVVVVIIITVSMNKPTDVRGKVLLSPFSFLYREVIYNTYRKRKRVNS